MRMGRERQRGGREFTFESLKSPGRSAKASPALARLTSQDLRTIVLSHTISSSEESLRVPPSWTKKKAGCRKEKKMIVSDELPPLPTVHFNTETHSVDVQVLQKTLVAGRLEVKDVTSEGEEVLLQNRDSEKSRAEREGA